MKILPSGNWSETWTDYKNRGPATTYYRKTDIVRALKGYDYDVTIVPGAELTNHMNAAEFVCDNVKPFRVVYT